MKNNGMLLLNEMVGNSLFFYIIFGFLEGWWLYEDFVVWISGCFGLYFNSWKVVLESEGFEFIFFLVEVVYDFSYQIVVVLSNGLVCCIMMKNVILLEKDVILVFNKELVYI